MVIRSVLSLSLVIVLPLVVLLLIPVVLQILGGFRQSFFLVLVNAHLKLLLQHLLNVLTLHVRA